jgi:hypothetical protein
MTYHTTCMDEISHCSNLEGLNISLAHGIKSMVRATNSVSLASTLLQKYLSQMPGKAPTQRLLAAPALGEGVTNDMDGDFPQWMGVGIRHLLQSSVNDKLYNTVVAKDGIPRYLRVIR